MLKTGRNTHIKSTKHVLFTIYKYHFFKKTSKLQELRRINILLVYICIYFIIFAN